MNNLHRFLDPDGRFPWDFDWLKNIRQPFHDFMGKQVSYTEQTTYDGADPYQSMPLEKAVQRDMVTNKFIADFSVMTKRISDNTYFGFGVNSESGKSSIAYDARIRMDLSDSDTYQQSTIKGEGIFEVQRRIYMDGKTVVDGKMKMRPDSYPIIEQSSNDGTCKFKVKVNYGGGKAYVAFDTNPTKMIERYR